MASVTGITAAKAQEIEDATVVSVFLAGDGSGNLIFETAGGSQINVGKVAQDAINVVPALVQVGSFDRTPETVVVPEWYSPTAPNEVLPDLSTVDNVHGISWSPDGLYLALGCYSIGQLRVFKRSGDTFTKLSDPATMPVMALDVEWSPDGKYLAVSLGSNSPYIYIYERNTSALTKLADPATLPASWVRSMSWSPDGAYLAAFHDDTPFVTIYKRDGSTFTKLGNPATLPHAAFGAIGGAFSPSGNHLVVVGDQTPYLTIYKRAGDVFTKLADVSDVPTGEPYGVSWSRDGKYLVAGTWGGAELFYALERSGDTFTSVDLLDVEPPSAPIDIHWSPDNQYIAMVGGTAPRINLYKKSGDVYVKLPDLPDLPANTAREVAWSPGGEYLAVGHDQTGTSLLLYKSSMGPVSGMAIAGTVLP